MDKKQTGGATFRHEEDRGAYFAACGMGDMVKIQHLHKYILAAVNELRDNDIDKLKAIVEENGTRLILDSGVYSLAMDLVRKDPTGTLTMDEVISRPVEELPGFSELLEKNIKIGKALEPWLWAHIEIDLGGRHVKTKLREMLEAAGLSPTPVFHPLLDGPGYGAWLMQNYDRICFGNIALTSRPVRRRIIASLWEYRRKFPDVYVHQLGITTSTIHSAYPHDSCDSSGWLGAVRWGGRQTAYYMGHKIGSLGDNMRYEMGSDSKGPTGHTKAVQTAAYQEHFRNRNVKIHVDNMQQNHGFDLWPPLAEGEEWAMQPVIDRWNAEHPNETWWPSSKG